MIVECDCGKRFRIDDSKAGVRIRCPSCRGVIEVPELETEDDEFERYEEDESWVDEEDHGWEDEEDDYDARPRRGAGRRSGGGRSGGGRPRRSSRGRNRGRETRSRRDDDEGRPGRCPECGSRDYKKVSWTLWGGIIGPAMLSHVKCHDCRTTFNSKSGRSNQTAITIFLVVSLAIGGVLGGIAVCAGAGAMKNGNRRRVEIQQPGPEQFSSERTAQTSLCPRPSDSVCQLRATDSRTGSIFARARTRRTS